MTSTSRVDRAVGRAVHRFGPVAICQRPRTPTNDDAVAGRARRRRRTAASAPPWAALLAGATVLAAVEARAAVAVGLSLRRHRYNCIVVFLFLNSLKSDGIVFFKHIEQLATNFKQTRIFDLKKLSSPHGRNCVQRKMWQRKTSRAVPVKVTIAKNFEKLSSPHGSRLRGKYIKRLAKNFEKRSALGAAAARAVNTRRSHYTRAQRRIRL